MMEGRRGYKKTKLGWIPEDWQVVKLSNIAEIKMGQSPDSNSYNDYGDGLHLIQGNADIKGRVSFPKIWTSAPTKICDIDDILMTVRAPVGAVAKSKHRACIGRGICAIRPEKIEEEFLFQILISHETKWKNIEQGSTFTAVGSNDVKNLKIATPTEKNEQRQIAAILSTVDEKIAAIDEQIAETEHLKKGLMQQLLTKGIGHSEFKDTKIGKIPKDWEVVRLGEIFTLKSGNFLPKKNIEDGFYPVYGGNGITNYHNKYIFDTWKIVIGRVGAKCGCIHITEKYSWITDNALYIDKEFRDFNFIFIFYLLKNANLNSYANKNAQPVISNEKIYSILKALPPIHEQEKIAAILSTVDEKLEVLREKKDEYRVLKKGLMQQLLTGSLRVRIKGD